jgi:arabinose-5-phosphate isomerase
MKPDFYNISQRVIREEAKALDILATKLPEDLPKVINAILETKGRVILLGMGKSGYIARKIASSLASTGTPAFYIHPGEASHGDLGMITAADIAIMLSNSGETKELSDSINYCKRFGIKIVAITMNPSSTLSNNSDFVLTIPHTKEASLLSAPTTSALMMLALGDAIIISLHEAKGFTKDDYFNFHPGGKIGANLIKVEALMRKGESLPLTQAGDSFSHFILIMTQKSLGCAAVTDSEHNLLGFITDGDLRRNINKDLTKLTAGDIMTKSPLSIKSEALVSEALFLMNSKSITALPVVGNNNRLCGIIHIHDILGAGVS